MLLKEGHTKQRAAGGSNEQQQKEFSVNKQDLTFQKINRKAEIWHYKPTIKKGQYIAGEYGTWCGRQMADICVHSYSGS